MERFCRDPTRFVHVPCGLYQGYGNPMPLGQPGFPGHKQPDWRQNMGPPTFLARTGLLVPTNIPHYYVDPYKRVQFKAILSQMNPNLNLLLGKANTKEMGVQVNPRVDKAVQCSLGPRNLRSLYSCSGWNQKTPLTSWRACCQTVSRRSLFKLWKDEDSREKKVLPGPPEGKQQQPSVPRAEEDKQEQLWHWNELGKEDSKGSPEWKSKQPQGDASQCLGRPKFQFLEPKYGYFHCKDCKTRWESAYVWCIAGTNKVYFKQLCCKCRKSFNPYRVEAIQCQTCLKSFCSCSQKRRHIDLRKPHRQELCGRCKDKKFSCGNVFNYKYGI
ncbi:protein ZAR1-like [Sorex araneus]|uniref:protein ZAR1-like n=1 Tax=Sorex araneus TaxID=42254 RepID=UPI0024337942|nr:protein ZAR1-like [Sorex araneus]